MTAQPRALVRFRRAIEHGGLWMAEHAARELPTLPLEDALQLVRLYAEKESPKFEKAALRWARAVISMKARPDFSASPSVGVQLLADCRRVFVARAVDRLTTEALIDAPTRPSACRERERSSTSRSS